VNRLKLLAVVTSAVLFGAGLLAQPAAPGGIDQPLLAEQKHFLQCLAYVYSPAFWISYENKLYFSIKTEEQDMRIHEMIDQRAKYVALTNRLARHQLATQALAQSGLDDSWQKKLLLPYSDTNANLTPTLDAEKVTAPLGSYLVLDLDGEGVLDPSRSVFNKDEVLVRAPVGTNVLTFVASQWTHAPHEVSGTNLWVIDTQKKRRYATSLPSFQEVPVLACVELSKEEQVILSRASAAFEKAAQALIIPIQQERVSERPATRVPERVAERVPEVARDRARETFNSYLSSASDSIPSIQFLVGKGYYEGQGTPKNEKLGLEWLNKAAKNGSGEAQAYLENLAQKK
jgi:hypothetical protein